MATIGDKKVSLALQDGSSINLNKPIDIPSTVTDITQITEPGWYHGKFTFNETENDHWDPDEPMMDASTVLNTPAMKIKDKLTLDSEYNFDVFVTKTGDYIFNLAGYLFYGVIKTIYEITSINWEIVSPNNTSSDAGVMKAPQYSTTDLTPGVSDLADGQIYIVYYN